MGWWERRTFGSEERGDHGEKAMRAEDGEAAVLVRGVEQGAGGGARRSVGELVKK